MSHLILFSARIVSLVNPMLDAAYQVDRPFVEHMIITGLLDVEAPAEAQVLPVIEQVNRAVRLGVWDRVA